jgi:hypothetical protein
MSLQMCVCTDWLYCAVRQVGMYLVLVLAILCGAAGRKVPYGLRDGGARCGWCQRAGQMLGTDDRELWWGQVLGTDDRVFGVRHKERVWLYALLYAFEYCYYAL